MFDMRNVIALAESRFPDQLIDDGIGKGGNKDRHSDYRCQAPIIALDASGHVTEIRMANFLRGPFDVPAHQRKRGQPGR